MPVLKCKVCERDCKVIPARVKTFKFCSYKCAGVWRKTAYLGESHPNWLGGERTKTCQHCGNEFSLQHGSGITSFKKQKFCSKACADKGGFRYSGESHYNWNGDSRRKHRNAKQRAWANAVIQRDNATCQHCGVDGKIELHAHHIKSYKEFPELRWEISNGLTLCYKCHWELHTKQGDIGKSANGVNSGKPAAGKAGGNPEPSLGGNVEEGVTTRGRAYRRWTGNCHECGKFLTKPLHRVLGKSVIFCGVPCRSKWNGRVRKGLPNGTPYAHRQ